MSKAVSQVSQSVNQSFSQRDLTLNNRWGFLLYHVMIRFNQNSSSPRLASPPTRAMKFRATISNLRTFTRT
jgi:phage tail sheath protein FI